MCVIMEPEEIVCCGRKISVLLLEPPGVVYGCLVKPRYCQKPAKTSDPRPQPPCIPWFRASGFKEDTVWCFVGNGGMDPYSSPYMGVSEN